MCWEDYALLINTVINKALGYLPEYIDQAMPSINFELGTHFNKFNYRSVTREDRPAISERLTEAFFWCANRFPLSVKTSSDSVPQQSIVQFVVGHSIHQDEILSASSAQAPGVVLMAACWPLKSPYRLASIIAHESMHQALYIRERISSLIRPGSLGYSPWKNSLRPGRLVWHSFWTFVCQFTMLSESVLEDDSLLQIDPKLTSFLADMQARILACSNSLSNFDIVASDEMEQCNSALSILDKISRELLVFPEYQSALKKAKDNVFEDFETWAMSLIESQADEQET